MCIHLFQFSTFHYIYICLSYMYPCPAYSYIFFMVCLPIKIHLSDKLLLIGILKKYPHRWQVGILPTLDLHHHLLYVTGFRQKYHYHETASSPIESPLPIQEVFYSNTDIFRSCLCFNIVKMFLHFQFPTGTDSHSVSAA